MNIRKFALVAMMTSVSGTMLMNSQQLMADSLILDGTVTCSSISSIDWVNDQLTITCDDVIVVPPVVIPPVKPPIVVPPVVKPPVVIPPANELPVNVSCPDPEPVLQIERFTGRGIDKEILMANETVLVVPFNSGELGTVRTISIGEPGAGEHFLKTVIISKCPGVYNPEEYDFASSVDICVITGLGMSSSVISGEVRSDYPTYRCVLEPNQQFYLNVIQRDSGRRPPFSVSTQNTCRTNRCGVRLSIR